VHGGEVIGVAEPGAGAGQEADGAVTTRSGAVLAVHTADCAPVALVSPHAVGVAHAGWRGVVAGVLDHAVARLRAQGTGPVTAVVGPRIGPECYEFGADDLAPLVDLLGDEVVGQTSGGTTALDLSASVRLALQQAGVERIHVVGPCTACGDGLFSHRARGERERQAVLVWIDP
jgi:purine-nucleoside/S-methyl-5'-thioadenosine phosphorylase / adenosine deaminase